MHLFFLPIFLPILLVVVLIRLVTAPLRWGRYHRRCGWGGYGYRNGWNGYGYRGGWGGYGDGYRRRGWFGGGLLTILGLLALERLFGRRW